MHRCIAGKLEKTRRRNGPIRQSGKRERQECSASRKARRVALRKGWKRRGCQKPGASDCDCHVDLLSRKNGKGWVFKSREQAIAIGLSEARKRGAKVPTKKTS